jgi:integrase
LGEPALKTIAGPRWEDFPEGLRRDVERYLTSLTKHRRSARGKRIRPCKASTIHTRRAELVAVIKTAARIVPLESLVCLPALLQPDLVEQILDSYWTRDGERPGAFTIDLAWKLTSIARETGAVDAAALERLDEMRAELEVHRRQGLTPKNLSLIRQVLSDGVWARVVHLPWQLMQQVRQLADHAPVKAAVTAQLAIAIAILSVAPVRLGNLGAIRLGDNLIRPGGVDQPYWLVFPDYAVKNDVALEFPLDRQLSDLIDEYVHDFRPIVARGSNEPWLFPGEGAAGHKGLTTLSTQIMERIQNATGLRITVHQFRHASAAILLKHRPGEYELVRRLLGHRNIQTTIRFYCGLETTQANEIFGRIVRDQMALTPELA